MFENFNAEHIVAFLVGVVLMNIVKWGSGWLDGTGMAHIKALLDKLQAKGNENELVSQISADEAVYNIIKSSIPLVLHDLTDAAKRDLVDGKFDKVEWESLGAQLWEHTKPQIVGGANDYLKTSSFADGKAIATHFLKLFFKKEQAVKKGLIAA